MTTPSSTTVRRFVGLLIAATLVTSGALFAGQPIGAQPVDSSWVTTSLPEGEVGQPYSVDIVVNTATDTTGCQIENLPNGLTYTPTSVSPPLTPGQWVCGTISGTPTDWETRSVSAVITGSIIGGPTASWDLVVNQAPQPSTTRPAPSTTTTSGSGSDSDPAVARPAYTG